MKLLLKAIAIGANERKSKKDPYEGAFRTTETGALAELNRLIDVAESSGLVVWHDNVCFKGSFWKWGKRTGTINWGGYGSSYRPENEKYFKFQYHGDTVKDGKLVIRKGAKPLDAVKALVLPEADTDGSVQKLMVDAGATVTVAGKGLKSSAILDAAKQNKCNFILTADSVPKGLAEALDKAAEAKTHIFTLPVGRLRPLLEKPVRTGVKRARKPLAFEDKDTARSFSKLKSLLSSQKLDEIEHAITLLPGIPGACDKLLEGITLKKGVNAWINDEETWKSSHGTGRPEVWAGKFDYSNQRDNVLPAKIKVEGDNLLVDEIPKNELFTGSDLRRYALMRVIAAAPDDCATAKSIRDGLLGLIWNYSGSSSSKPIMFPPLGVFKALKHLYLDLRHGKPSNTADFPDSLRTLVVDNYRDGLDWLPENEGVTKATIAGRAASLEGIKHLKGLKELALKECKLVTSLEVLRGAKKLKSLSLRKCASLASVRALEDCTALETLDLEMCAALRSLEGLAQLPLAAPKTNNGTAELSLDGCHALTSLAHLPAFGKTLMRLSLNDTRDLKDLQGLRDLPALKSLRARNSGLTDLRHIGVMPALTEVNLSGCEALKDATPLGTLRYLQAVDLSSSAVTELPKGWSGPITTLTLENCEALSDLGTPPASLRELHARGCKQLTAVTGLQSCPQLQVVGLPVSITDASALKHLAPITIRLDFNELGAPAKEGELLEIPKTLIQALNTLDRVHLDLRGPDGNWHRKQTIDMTGFAQFKSLESLSFSGFDFRCTIEQMTWLVGLQGLQSVVFAPGGNVSHILDGGVYDSAKKVKALQLRICTEAKIEPPAHLAG